MHANTYLGQRQSERIYQARWIIILHSTKCCQSCTPQVDKSETVENGFLDAYAEFSAKKH